MPEETKQAGGLGELQTDVAAGTTHVASDLNMIRRALREGWPVPAEKRPQVIDRLFELTQKREVTVMTKEGPAMLDAPADANAIKAASVLLGMTTHNEQIHQYDDKNDRLDKGKATENVAFTAPAVYDVPLPDAIRKRLTGTN